jgi:hypothetical protein
MSVKSRRVILYLISEDTTININFNQNILDMIQIHFIINSVLNYNRFHINVHQVSCAFVKASLI